MQTTQRSIGPWSQSWYWRLPSRMQGSERCFSYLPLLGILTILLPSTKGV
ncbi:hypothetical protein [Pseudomonas sp. R5(2019)]|nr:hypothetical protein [Pseudomonas sp. R5(2019)]NBA98476.1 hypothetical protein [Pseudomonas sp. R5(2019)]